MNCPQCGSQELTVLESRQNKVMRKGSNWENRNLESAIQDAIETFGENWPHGLAADISEKYGATPSHVGYRKKLALEVANKFPNGGSGTAPWLIKQLNAPFIRRRRECLKCQHRFTTYELHETVLSELRPMHSDDDYPLDGYTVMKAYAKAIRTLEQSMEKSLRSATYPKTTNED